MAAKRVLITDVIDPAGISVLKTRGFDVDVKLDLDVDELAKCAGTQVGRLLGIIHVALAVTVKLLHLTHDSSNQLLERTNNLQAIVFLNARKILPFSHSSCMCNQTKRWFFVVRPYLWFPLHACACSCWRGTCVPVCQRFKLP